MRKIVEVTEVDGEGLTALMGENVALFCMNYTYAGKLIGVNDSCVLLQNASIVYDFGPLVGTTYQDAQPLPNEWYVAIGAIESFGKSGR